MKTCSRHETDMPTADQLAAVLEFIPLLEAPEFCPNQEIPMDEDGFPEEDYKRLVTNFMDACYKNGFVVKFDWEHWEATALTYQTEPSRLAEADLPTLRRLLTWHIRQNRFTRDHIATQIANGTILGILKRLVEVTAQ